MTEILKGPLPNAASVPTSTSEASATSRWAFINKWNVTPQENDRTPMLGPVAPVNTGQAAQRSAARRKHQVSFKEWSQARRD